MNRRNYLAAAGTLLAATAGCVANGQDAIDEPPMREVTNVTVSGLESTDVSIQPVIERAEITSEQTSTLSFTANWNGENKRRFVFGNSIPFDSPNRSTESRGLVLIKDGYEPERKNNKTWVPESEDALSTGDLTLMEPVLSPGESTDAFEWHLWADPTTDSSIEPGTYNFNNKFTSKSVGESESREEIEWSLTVEIQEKQ